MRRCDKLAELGARDWRRALPHLNTETARRHVFVFPRVAYAPRCACWWAAPLVIPEFADVARVSVGGYEEFAGAFQREKTKRLAPRQRAHPETLVPRLVSAPYAARHVPTPGNAPRSYLWAYAASRAASVSYTHLTLPTTPYV